MLYLASKSPRRKLLLEQLGVKFEAIDIEIDETWDGIENPKDYVTRLALEKARAGKASIDNTSPILAADTEVVIDNKILGKPRDEANALHMLRLLSGRTHEVFSAVALVDNIDRVVLNISRVSFRGLTTAECEAYINTGEPLDKAGAYAIQGRAAAFISRMEGSYSGVMGLPLFETEELLKYL